MARLALALVLSGSLTASSPCVADDAADRKAADPGHFDYAVPDAPAFQLLDVDADAILRPGTRRELSMVLDKADLKNFGVEAAPFLLMMDQRISLKEYRDHAQRYRFRVSFGARTSDEFTRAAIGLRWSLLDSNDPYTSRELEAAAVSAGTIINRCNELADSLAAENLLSDAVWSLIPANDQKDVVEFLKDPKNSKMDAYSGLPDSTRKKIQVLYGREACKQAARDQFDEAAKQFKEVWNRTILEFGVAAGGQGNDTLASKARATAYGGWLTGGIKLGSKGQLTGGGNTRLVRNDATGVMDVWTGAAGLRVYYGTNPIKVAGGGDIGWKTDGLPTYTGQLRGEIEIVPSIWVTPVVSLTRNPQRRPVLSTQMSLRFANLGAIPIAEFLKLAKAAP